MYPDPTKSYVWILPDPDLQSCIIIEDADGQTPLHYACSCEHVAMAEILLNAGADPAMRDTDGNTPLTPG